LALIAPVVVRMLGLEPLKAHEEEQKSADSERRVTKIR
jgi:hypothetical protein